MKLKFVGNTLEVVREPSDPRYPHGMAGESRLLHQIKLALNKQGLDLIKKPMWKDDHMTADTQKYLRARRPTKDRAKNIAIWDGNYAIRSASQDFNTSTHEQPLVYTVVRGIWERTKKKAVIK